MNEIFGLPANTLLNILLALTGIILGIVGLSAWFYPLSFRLGVRNLPRRKSQTVLVVGGLALSTMIITSALGIGDTIDYSSKVDVYDDLGAVDIQISTTALAAQTNFSFSSGPAQEIDDEGWFDAGVGDRVAALVRDDAGRVLDASVPAILQTLPVVNSANSLSEAGVQIRDIGAMTGDGFTLPPALGELEAGRVRSPVSGWL